MGIAEGGYNETSTCLKLVIIGTSGNALGQKGCS
jgi:hypothetical protein